MCGIAGYNVSEGFYNSQFGRKTARRVASQALLGNLHRGRDAAGWMSWTVDDRFAAQKVIGPANLLVGNDVLPSRKTTVLGVHTRAATTGSPDQPENNHPVIWNGVLITHNGMISNHLSVKNLVKQSGNIKVEKIPDVDSVALAMIVSEICPDPTKADLEKLGDTLAEEISGSYAFSALWEKYPGYQLMVRGQSSPMQVAISKAEGNEFIIYSSEDSNLLKMVEKLGAKKYDPELGTFLVGTIVLAKGGTVVDTSSFTPKKHFSYTRYATSGYDWDDDYTGPTVNYKATMIRQSRYSSLEQENYGNWHWTKEKAPLSVIDGCEDYNSIIDLIEEDLLTKPPFSVRNTLADADFIYAWLPSYVKGEVSPSSTWGWANGEARYYGIFGSMEVIMDARGKIHDIINWDLHESIEEVWQDMSEGGEEEAKKANNVIVLNVGSSNQTMGQCSVPTVDDDSKVTIHISEVFNQVFTDEWLYEELTAGEKVARAKRIKDNTNLWEHSYKFIDDWECEQHHQKYTKHQFPAGCDETLIAARDTAIWCGDVFTLAYVYGLEIIFSEYNPIQNTCQHNWETKTSRLNRRRGQEFAAIKERIPMTAECTICKKQAKITLPNGRVFDFDPWMNKMVGV